MFRIPVRPTLIVRHLAIIVIVARTGLPVQIDRYENRSSSSLEAALTTHRILDLIYALCPACAGGYKVMA